MKSATKSPFEDNEERLLAARRAVQLSFEWAPVAGLGLHVQEIKVVADRRLESCGARIVSIATAGVTTNAF